jgi:hypothetical protein
MGWLLKTKINGLLLLQVSLQLNLMQTMDALNARIKQSCIKNIRLRVLLKSQKPRLLKRAW